MNHKRLFCAGALLCGILASTPVVGSPWSNPAGSNTRFAWSNGQNQTDLFGSPNNVPGGLFFTNPINFRAEGGGGTGNSVVDIAQAIVDTASVGALPLNHYHVKEWGTWDIGGSGSELPQDVFTLQGDISVLRMVPGPAHFTQLNITASGLTFYPDGTWEALGSILSPAAPGEWVRGLFKASSTLQVNGDAPAGSWIQLDGMQMTLPEPSSLALLLVGGSLVLRLRRRV